MNIIKFYFLTMTQYFKCLRVLIPSSGPAKGNVGIWELLSQNDNIYGVVKANENFQTKNSVFSCIGVNV